MLGRPVFGPEAPQLRVRGRRISNWWANLETLGAGIGDSLFGFRVYPIAPLLRVMRRGGWMRRFDFDPEAAVRLAWAGLPLVNIPAPVRYLQAEDGGVSHFRYGRDNVAADLDAYPAGASGCWRGCPGSSPGGCGGRRPRRHRGQ